jgi:hypothetical protein
MSIQKICATIIVASFVGLFLCCTAVSGSQPILFFNPDVVESNTGDDEEVLLMMDGAMRGLSGYGIRFEVDDPDIAEITSVELPVWVGLGDVQRLNDGAYLVQGVDDTDKQVSGAVQITMAHIRIHAKAPGYATISANPIAVDDDVKGRYQPVHASGTIVITGAGPVPVIPMSTE